MIDPSWLSLPFMVYPLWEAAHVRLREISLSFPSLPAAWDGAALLWVSDCHTVRRGRRERNLERLLDGQSADFLLLGGDIAVDAPGCRAVLQTLSRVQVREGKYAIWGNAENLKRVRQDEIARPLTEAGYALLNNRSEVNKRQGSPLALVGVDCPYSHKADFDAAFRAVPDDVFRILLMHAPEGLLDIKAHRADLILSGHTHGGQIRLPGLPAFHLHTDTDVKLDRGTFAATELRRFWSEAPENARMVIGAGVGTSTLPVRLFCPPEVLKITLRSGEAGG